MDFGEFLKKKLIKKKDQGITWLFSTDILQSSVRNENEKLYPKLKKKLEEM